MERKPKKKIKHGHRLFIGIIASKELRDQARDVQRVLASYSYKLRFVNLEQVHLTLKFLGNNVSTQNADLVIETLFRNAVNFSRFSLQTDNVQFGFPTQNKANTLFISIENSPELMEIAQSIQNVTKSLRLDDVIRRKDPVKFMGHFTVARVKKDISRSQIREIRSILASHNFPAITCPVSELHIIESRLTLKGPVYNIFARIPLIDRSK